MNSLPLLERVYRRALRRAQAMVERSYEPMVYIHLRVKFRAFFITFGQYDQKITLPLGIPIPLPDFDTVLVNERGVYLRASSNPIV